MTEKKGEFKLVGLKLGGKTTNKNNQSAKDCGDLWQKFESDKLFELIPKKISNAVYAVYYDYEKDETGAFSYFIGCRVDRNTKVPNALQELVVPSQAYRKFTAKGVMTGCITDAWKEIWKADLKREFGFDFEVYDERSQDWNNAEVDIFISTSEQ